MSSRELSAEELRKLANYLSQQANDLEMTLEAVKKSLCRLKKLLMKLKCSQKWEKTPII